MPDIYRDTFIYFGPMNDILQVKTIEFIFLLTNLDFITRPPILQIHISIIKMDWTEIAGTNFLHIQQIFLIEEAWRILLSLKLLEPIETVEDPIREIGRTLCWNLYECY